MYFYNKDSGIVVGNRGDIQYTTNGGINWFYNSNTQNMTTKNLNKFVFNFGIAAASGDSGIIIYTDSITLGFSSGGRNVPGEFKLYQNYPNPFNPVTKIKFEIPGSVSYSDFKAEIRIFDLLGKEVISVNEQLKPGIYEFEWDASNYSSGVYYYQLTVTAEQVSRLTDTKKMVLIK
jgi:hypothetical protein